MKITEEQWHKLVEVQDYLYELRGVTHMRVQSIPYSEENIPLLDETFKTSALVHNAFEALRTFFRAFPNKVSFKEGKDNEKDIN